MRRLLLFLLAVFSAALATPRTTAAEPIILAKRLPAATIPRLLVPDGTKRRSLALTSADISIDIAGHLAQTTVTLTFSNDTNRVLEGELVFPLPEGVTISGYGLDVQGQIVEGVPVEKQAARIAFEKEVRKGVDPGLVEQTVGNTFRTRVYPIPARGSRTLRLRWASELETDPAAGLATYTLRQRTENALEKLTLRVTANHPPGLPQNISSGMAQNRLELSFQKTNDGYRAEQTLTNTPLTGDITFTFGKAAQPGPVVATELFKRSSAPTSETFFTITDTVPNAPTRVPRPVRRLRRLGIVWDASMSRRSANTNRECQIIAALLRGWYQRTPQSVDVEVTVLRDIPEAPRHFVIRGGDSRKLIAFLRAVSYDGGTNLAALNLTRKGTQGQRDLWLVFSDGVSNLGVDKIPQTVGASPVFAFASDVRANHGLLRLLCQRTQGAYLNLDRLARNTDVVQQVLYPNQFSLVSVTVSPLGAASGLYPAEIQNVLSRGRITVAGKLLAEQASITLDYGLDKSTITSRRTVLVRRAGTPHRSSGLLGRFWAQRKADSLAPLARTNHAALIALGQDFGIVTPRTSLLVLETLQQHLDHRIAPARSRVALYDAYLGRIQQESKASRRQENARLDSISKAWKERIRWWSKPINYQMQRKKRLGSAAGFATVNGAVALDRRIPAVSRPAPNLRVSAYSAYSPTRSAGEQPMNAQARPPAPIRLGSRIAQEEVLYDLSSESKGSRSGSDGRQAGSEITIRPWSPKTPYLAAMRAAGSKRAYAVYLAQRPRYQTSPAFYLDCAEFLLQRGQTALGLRVLTNIAELGLEDAQLMRIVAHRLFQAGRRDLAILQFERIRILRPEEPQSLRDLALVLIDRADDRAASADASIRRHGILDYNRGFALLYQVVLKRWDRFEGIEEIALMEAGRSAARARWTLPASERSQLRVPFSTSLLRNLPCDTRILMTWDTDATDMDLWVTEPTGEKCYYSYNRTAIGGHLSSDFTQGYGPEEYLLRREIPGKYRIQSDYYGTSQQKLTGGTTVQATVISNWGRRNEKRRYLTLRLTTAQKTVTIGTIVAGAR